MVRTRLAHVDIAPPMAPPGFLAEAGPHPRSTSPGTSPTWTASRMIVLARLTCRVTSLAGFTSRATLLARPGSRVTPLARLASPLTLLALLTLILAVPARTARSQTAEQIIARAEDLVKGTSCKGSFTMTVVTPSYTRTVKMDSWWVGNDKALIVVRYPKKEEGNKTLKIGNELWSYLKNTETTIKLPPSMMLQSWNGSDFTNDDLVRESNLSKDYRQTIVRLDTVQGERCWVIELVPRPDAPVVWGKILYAVRQSDNLPAWQDYFDERGALMRRMQFGDYKAMGGRKIPTTWAMLNMTKDGHRTELGINSIQFDVPISDRMFSYRELELRE